MTRRRGYKPAPFTMPNGKCLRAYGRCGTPEKLYNDIVNQHTQSPESLNVGLISRSARVSTTTVYNIIKAHTERRTDNR